MEQPQQQDNLPSPLPFRSRPGSQGTILPMANPLRCRWASLSVVLWAASRFWSRPVSRSDPLRSEKESHRKTTPFCISVKFRWSSGRARGKADSRRRLPIRRLAGTNLLKLDLLLSLAPRRRKHTPASTAWVAPQSLVPPIHHHRTSDSTHKGSPRAPTNHGAAKPRKLVCFLLSQQAKFHADSGIGFDEHGSHSVAAGSSSVNGLDANDLADVPPSYTAS